MKRSAILGTATPFGLLLTLALLWGVGLLAWVILQEPPQAQLKGTVTVLATGNPVPDAKVLLRGLEGPAKGRVFRQKSDGQGRFTWARLPIGRYEIEASAQIQYLPPQPFELREGERKKLLLELVPRKTFLRLLSPQHVFTTREPVRLGLHGFVETDTLTVEMARYDLLRALTGDAATRERARRWEWEEKPPPETFLRRVLAKRYPITGRDAEGIFTQYVDLSGREPGAYWITIRAGKQSQRVGILVSDLALVVKEDGQQMWVWAADLETGKPQPNVTIQVFPPGTSPPFKPGKTNQQGLFSTGFPSPQSGRFTVLGQREKQFSVATFYAHPSSERPAWRAYLYTERPVYRPGHRVHFKGILRQRGNRKPGTENRKPEPPEPFQIPAPQEVTVEARDGRGNLVWRGKKHSNGWGSFGGQFVVPEEAATGYFDLVAEMGREEQRTQFVVSSYRKPEYEVKLLAAKPYFLPGDPVRIELEAQYYFSTPVVNAEVVFTVRRHPTHFRPRAKEETSPWEDLFFEESSEAYGEWVFSKKVRTDGRGKARLIFDPRRVKGQELPEPAWDEWEPQAREWEYVVEAEVTDASRRYVNTNTSVMVTPGDFYVDVDTISYLTSLSHPVTVRLLVHDYEGRPQQNVKLNVAVGRAEWRENPQGEWKRQVDPRSTGAKFLQTNAEGEALFEFTPDKEGEWLIRALTTDPRKNRLGGGTSLFVWEGKGESLPGYRYGGLELTLDRKRYGVGDTARAVLNLKKPSGTAWLTVEGDQLYQSWMLPLRKNSEITPVPVRPHFRPNVFVSATRVRDKRLEQRTAKLKVEAGERLLTVEVTPDKTTTRPGEAVTYTIRTLAQGKPVPAEISLAVVDEALYAIRRDRPERLIQAFYAEQYNRVNTHFSSPEYYLQGGKDEGGRVRKEFPDTAFWKPDLVTGPDGMAQVTVTLPDSLTTWRATALAHTRDTAVGFGVTRVVSRLDFLVRLQTPRFVTQGDEVNISAMVHNDTDRTEAVTVELQGLSPGPFQTEDRIQAHGKVPAHGQRRFDWQVQTLGIQKGASLQVSAWTRSGWRDTVRKKLPIVPYALKDRSSRSGELPPGTVTETVKVTPDLLREVSELTVSVAPSMAGSVLRSLETLADYPYGCVEQTMSRFLPDVLVTQAWQQLGWPAPAGLQEKLPDMVAQGLLRLYNFQHGDGGWGWWEYDSSQVWMTAYVVYGLQECRRAGFEVNPEALERGLQWLEGRVRRHSTHRAWGDTEAFALYVLARGGKEIRTFLLPQPSPSIPEPSPAAMILRYGSPTNRALAWLVLALQEAGQGDEAKPLVGRLLSQASETSRDFHWGDVETTALGLRAVLGDQKENPILPKVVHWLMLQWDGRAWISTRATSLTIAALVDYLKAREWAPPQATVRLWVNGERVQSVTFTPTNLQDPDIRWKVPATQLSEGENTLRLVCEGKGRLYYTVAFEQYRAVEEMPQRLSAVGFSLERRYRQVSLDRRGKKEFHPLGVNRPLARGSILRGEIILRTEQPVRHLVVEEPLPAGCEVMERGDLQEWEWREAGYWWAQRDLRDEKVAFFIDRLDPGQYTLFYTLRAEIPGTYRVLPTRAEGMYEPELHTTGGEDVIEIQE